MVTRGGRVSKSIRRSRLFHAWRAIDQRDFRNPRVGQVRIDPMLADDGRGPVCPLSRRPSLPPLEQAVKIIRSR